MEIEASQTEAALQLGDGQKGGESSRYLFTVFTATFNRERTLHRVYDSLCLQTYKDFEWLIVDDGSTDGTPALVAKWIEEAPFPIRYIRQENRGKHFAMNKGTREAQGELFINLDSDDGCVPESLERFAYHWQRIDAADRENFAGLTMLCKDQFGNLIGNRFPEDPLDTEPVKLRYKYKVRGEKWGLRRTRIQQEFPFPEDLVGTCVPENIVWDAIGRKYKTRFINEALRIYYVETDNNSLIHSPGKHRRLAPGVRVALLLELNDNIKFLPDAPIQFAKIACIYVRASFHVGVGALGQLRSLRNAAAKLLWAMAIVPGYMVYTVDSRK